MAERDVYSNKVNINHWHDKFMEHKKIFYTSELKMYQLELTLAKWDNSRKLRWSFRNCEIPSPVFHEERRRPRTREPKEPNEEKKQEEKEEEPDVANLITESSSKRLKPDGCSAWR